MRQSLSKPAVLAVLLGLVGTPVVAGAQEDVFAGGPMRSGGGTASEGAEFLLLPVGAKSVGMGGAVTGLRGDGELVLWNPAGVAHLDKRRLLVNHSEGAFDTRSQVLALLWPTKSFGTLGVTYYLVDYGELTSTDPYGSEQGTINFRNQEFLRNRSRSNWCASLLPGRGRGRKRQRRRSHPRGASIISLCFPDFSKEVYT